MPAFGIPTPPQPKDEGGSLPRRLYTDYVGAGVTATDDAANNKTIVTIPGGGSVSVQDEGTSVPSRGSLNFTGNGVAATDDPANNRTQIYIPGAVGGTTNYPATILTPEGPSGPHGGDDSPQLQAAFNATALAGGGTIIINGRLRLKTKCTYDGNNLHLTGAGWGLKSGVEPFDSSYLGMSLIRLGADDPSGEGSGVFNKISELLFWGLAGKTGGAAIEFATSYSDIVNCVFYQQYECIAILGGSQEHRIDGCQFWAFSGDAIRCDVTYGGWLSDGGARGNDQRIFQCIFWGSRQTAASGKAAIHWKTSDPLIVTDCEIMMCDIGIKIAPTADEFTSEGTCWGWVSGTSVDESISCGILIDGTLNLARYIFFSNVYVMNTGANPLPGAHQAVVIKGQPGYPEETVNNIQFRGGVIGTSLSGAAFSGVSFEGPSVFSITFDGVAFRTVGTWMSFTNGVSYNDIEVVNCRAELGGTINFNGATFTNSRFENNNLTSVTVANASGLISSASRSSIVQGNLNWKPAATTPSIPSSGVAINNPNPFGCTVYISSGSVSAIIVNGITTGLTGGAVRVPQGGTIQLTYSAAPSWTWVADW
jgi:hypothetical protein